MVVLHDPPLGATRLYFGSKEMIEAAILAEVNEPKREKGERGNDNSSWSEVDLMVMLSVKFVVEVLRSTVMYAVHVGQSMHPRLRALKWQYCFDPLIFKIISLRFNPETACEHKFQRFCVFMNQAHHLSPYSLLP